MERQVCVLFGTLQSEKFPEVKVEMCSILKETKADSGHIYLHKILTDKSEGRECC